MSGRRRARTVANNDVGINTYEGVLREWRRVGDDSSLAELIGPRICKDIRDVTANTFTRQHKLFEGLLRNGCANALFHSSKMLVAVRCVFGMEPRTHICLGLRFVPRGIGAYFLNLFTGVA